VARPMCEGDLGRIGGRAVGRSGGPAGGELVLELMATRDGGQVAATAVAGLAWGGAPVRPDLAAYPVRPLPTARAAATPTALDALGPLGSPELELDPDTAAGYAPRGDDPLHPYRGPAGAGHPRLLLQ